MQLGIVGLGRMGGNIARRLMRAATVRGLRPQRQAASTASPRQARPARDLADLVQQLKPPRAVWVMLPAGELTEDTVAALAELPASKGDTIIDGGNTFYQGRHPPRQGAAREGHRTMSTSAPPAASGAWSAATA